LIFRSISASICPTVPVTPSSMGFQSQLSKNTLSNRKSLISILFFRNSGRSALIAFNRHRQSRHHRWLFIFFSFF
jgi:hypothetical protein